MRFPLWCVCVLFLATSCVETIVMDPHEEMPAVVYCVLTNKSDVQTLDLIAVESPSGIKPEVTAKEVVVTASTGVRYAFESSDGVRWSARFRPVPLEKYSLHVALARGGELVAETTYPDTLAINDNYYEGGIYKQWGYDRIFDERYGEWSPYEAKYSDFTRQFGFKLLEPKVEEGVSTSQIIRHDMRYWAFTHEGSGLDDGLSAEEEENDKVALWEIHPYQKACILWITARSPQKPEEFPLNALYVPGHTYQSAYLATDNTCVDNFNALQVTLGDLSCYSMGNVERIERAIEDRDRELIPSLYNIWSSDWVGGETGMVSWYGNNLKIRDDFQRIVRYSNLPLHYQFLRIVYPEGGYRNQNTLSLPERYNNLGDAIWIRNKDSVVEASSRISSQIPSPFTFQLFADFNVEDPYSWQRSAHRLSSGWVVFEFHNVSEEYDTFLRTLYRAGYSDVFGDLTETLYSREGVYSNIKGGVGIFGAECVTVSLR